MRFPTWTTYFWPGLPRVWASGDLGALLWAATFAIALNCALIVTFVWPELVSPPLRSGLWSGLATVWLASAVWYAWRFRFEAVGPRHLADLEPVFVQAQEEYLRGEWDQAEGTLRKLLRSNPRDVEGHLMLATLMRHAERWDEAERQLKRLEQLEAAAPWRLEIQREHELVGKHALPRAQDAADSEEREDGEDGEEMDVVTAATDVKGLLAANSEAA